MEESWMNEMQPCFCDWSAWALCSTYILNSPHFKYELAMPQGRPVLEGDNTRVSETVKSAVPVPRSPFLRHNDTQTSYFVRRPMPLLTYEGCSLPLRVIIVRGSIVSLAV